MIASAVDGEVYLAEGNYAMAAMCFLDAVIPAVGILGKILSTIRIIFSRRISSGRRKIPWMRSASAWRH